MPEKIAIDLGNVQKTLFLPLWGRAYESKRPRPLLVDKLAVEIMAKVDYDFSTLAQTMSPLSQLAWIMRSLCVDDAVRACLAKYPQATIVNIGCGLDTTFERVDNGTLSWYDLDLPDVIRLRRQLIPETDRRKFIAASFLEQGWLQNLRGATPVFCIAAGVFYYFAEADIRAFLGHLAETCPGSEIVFDVSSPYGVKIANRKVIQKSGLDERSFLKWGLPSARMLTTWDERIRLLHTYYYFGARARSLPLRLRLLGWLSDRLQVQYMVHLGMRPGLD